MDLTDLDTITTPGELRRAVKLALAERVAIGDTLAPGVLKVIDHLERQANTLAWANGARIIQGDHKMGAL
jgi:hypothetical protein